MSHSLNLKRYQKNIEDSNIKKQFDSSKVDNKYEIDSTLFPNKRGNKQKIEKIPEILTKGVVLWKIPFHTFGQSQKRRLQIKKSRRRKQIQLKGSVNSSPFKSKRIQPYEIDTTNDYDDNDENPNSSLILVILHDIDNTNPKNKYEQTKKEIPITDIKSIKLGCDTPAFAAYITRHGQKSISTQSLTFSLILANRTIDLSPCDNHHREACEFRDALINLITHDNEGIEKSIPVSYNSFFSPIKPLVVTDRDKKHKIDHLSVSCDEIDTVASISKKEGILHTISMTQNFDEKELFSAVRSGNLHQFKVFLENGCPIDFMEKGTGDTPLIVACRLGKCNIVEYALEYQAKNDPHPDFGQTALQAAVSSGQTACVHLLLQTAAPSKSDIIIVNHEDFNREAPLHVASRCGNLAIIELLILHGAHIHLVDSENRTCLHCAAQGGHTHCLAYLLDVGGDSIVEERDCNGNTCLHYAIKSGEESCVKLLIETAANVWATTSEGLNSYQIAVARRRHSLARLLLEYEPSLDSNYKQDFSDDVKLHVNLNDPYIPPSREQLPRPWTTNSVASNSSMLDRPKKSSSQSMYDGLDLFSISCGASIRQDDSNGAMLTCQQSDYFEEAPNHSLWSRPEWNSAMGNTNIYQTNFRENTSLSSLGHANGYNSDQNIYSMPTDNPLMRGYDNSYTSVTSELNSFDMNNVTVPSVRRTASLSKPIFSMCPTGHNFDQNVQVNSNLLQYSQDSYGFDEDNKGYVGAHCNQTNNEIMHPTMFQYPRDFKGYNGDGGLMLNPFHNQIQQQFSRGSHGFMSYQDTNRINEQLIMPPKQRKVRKQHKRNKVTVVGSARDTVTNQIYSIKEFKINDEIWNIHYNSGHPYFLRLNDDHSEWTDPRRKVKEINVGSRKSKKSGRNNEREKMDISSELECIDGDKTYSNSPGKNEINSRLKVDASSHIDDNVSIDCVKQDGNEGQVASPQKKTGDSSDGKPKTQETGMLDLNDSMLKEGLKRLRKRNVQSMKSGGTQENEVNDSLDKGKNSIREKLSLDQELHIDCGDVSEKEQLKKDHPELTKYFKMVSVGVPMPSVLHKMTQEGIDGTIRKVFEQLNSTTVSQTSDSKTQKESYPRKKLKEDHPELSKYFKMVSVGVPLESVLHKMKQDGIEQSMVKSFERSNNPSNPILSLKCKQPTKEELKKHPELAKYVKMVSVGVPVQSALHKMKQDGITAEKISLFSEANGLALPEKHTPVAKKKCKQPTKEELKKHPELAKYVKMVSVGVPVQSALHKMKQDGITAEKISLFSQAHGLNAPEKSSPMKKSQKSNNNNNELLCVPSARRASVTLQKIHWKAVSEKNLENSLWAEKVDEKEEELDQAEIEQLESLFGAKPHLHHTNTKTLNKSNSLSKNKPKKESVNLIDMKRANNIAISLAQFRNFQNYDDLCRSVVSFDETRLNAEKLQNMQTLLPTAAELKVIQQYNGGMESLGRAELFFIAVSKISRFAKKLHAFEFSLQFQEQVNDLSQSLHLLHQACEEVIQSQKLAGMLRRLLAVGNLMNESTGQPKAVGITVDSLLKTAKKKGSDGKTTVLDHIVATIMKQQEQQEEKKRESGEGVNVDEKRDQIIDFWLDMPSVKESLRLDIHDNQVTFRELRTNLKRVEQAVECETKELNEMDHENNDDNRNQSQSHGKEENRIFVQKSGIFLKEAVHKMKEMEEKLKGVEGDVSSLCHFFAEDPKNIQTTTIFAVLLDFSKLVDGSKERWIRRRKLEKRKSQKAISGSISSKS